jgi:hypothetical protein
VNPDQYLVVPGPSPLRVCPPLNCRKPCLIGCGDFYYQQYPKIRYLNDQIDQPGGPPYQQIGPAWNVYETNKICGRVRFDEEFSTTYDGSSNGASNFLDVGSSGPYQACGDIFTCCGTGTWETDGSCLNSIAVRQYMQYLRSQSFNSQIDTEFGPGGTEWSGNQFPRENNTWPVFAQKNLLSTIIDRKFYYRWTFCPALRRDQPLTATIEFVYLPAKQDASQWMQNSNFGAFGQSPFNSDILVKPNATGEVPFLPASAQITSYRISPGLVAQANLVRQYIQSCDGATVLTGGITGWNIDAGSSNQTGFNPGLSGYTIADAIGGQGDDNEGSSAFDAGLDGVTLLNETESPIGRFASRRLNPLDQIPYIGHMCVKIANPLDRTSWCQA